MQPLVSVCVPFFQRRKGLLRRAVESVLRQRGVEQLEIVVVDDESPIAAREELSDLLPVDARIRVLEQPNRGPAAARNRALDSIDPRTNYVAFLDSDDEWTADHLGNALSALEQGYDFYFSDGRPVDSGVTTFEKAGFPGDLNHEEVGRGGSLYRHGGSIAGTILSGVINTPTVVYRYKSFPEVRFPEDLVHFGEDQIFWLALAERTDRYAFSSRVEALYGHGVNIYSESVWGTRKFMRQLHHQTRFRRRVERELHTPREERLKNRRKILKLREDFVLGLAHMLRRCPAEIEWNVCRDQLRADPWMGVLVLPLLAKGAARRLLRAEVQPST